MVGSGPCSSSPSLSESSRLAAFWLPLTYGMYALFAALSFFVVLGVVPETKGVSLEETGGTKRDQTTNTSASAKTSKTSQSLS